MLSPLIGGNLEKRRLPTGGDSFGGNLGMRRITDDRAVYRFPKSLENLVFFRLLGLIAFARMAIAHD